MKKHILLSLFIVFFNNVLIVGMENSLAEGEIPSGHKILKYPTFGSQVFGGEKNSDLHYELIDLNSAYDPLKKCLFRTLIKEKHTKELPYILALGIYKSENQKKSIYLDALELIKFIFDENYKRNTKEFCLYFGSVKIPILEFVFFKIENLSDEFRYLCKENNLIQQADKNYLYFRALFEASKGNLDELCSLTEILIKIRDTEQKNHNDSLNIKELMLLVLKNMANHHFYLGDLGREFLEQSDYNQDIYLVINFYEKAKKGYVKLIKDYYNDNDAEKVVYNKKIVRTLYLLGIVCFRKWKQSNYKDKDTCEKVIKYWGEIVELYEKVEKDVNDKHEIVGLAIIYGNLGFIYDFQGNLGNAIKYLKKAIEFWEKNTETIIDENMTCGKIMNLLGGIYRKKYRQSLCKKDQKNFKEIAINWYEKSIINGDVDAMCNLGNLYDFFCFDCKKAKKYYLMAILNNSSIEKHYFYQLLHLLYFFYSKKAEFLPEEKDIVVKMYEHFKKSVIYTKIVNMYENGKNFSERWKIIQSGIALNKDH